MKIVLTGTQNSGKTSLIKLLSTQPEFQNYKVFTEKSKEIRDIGIPLNTDSTLKGQSVFLAHRCIELMESDFISDRSLIDVMAYCTAAPSINYQEKEDFCNLAKHYISEYDYVFYASPLGIEIEDNGVRCIDYKYRDLINSIIENLLRKYGYKIKNLIFIPPYLTNEERVEFIKSKIGL